MLEWTLSLLEVAPKLGAGLITVVCLVVLAWVNAKQYAATKDLRNGEMKAVINTALGNLRDIAAYQARSSEILGDLKTHSQEQTLKLTEVKQAIEQHERTAQHASKNSERVLDILMESQ